MRYLPMKYKPRTYIRYDAERDKSFPLEIKKMPGCENMDRCIQCATCSGACPLSIYMDYTPRKIIELTRSGFKKDVLSSFTIWICSSCYACTAECPKEIGITDVMYALKQKAIQEKAYPRNFPIPVLAREFFRMVRNKGRVTEGRLAMNLYLKALLWRIFRLPGMGLKLMRTGRLSMRAESIRDSQKLRKLLDAVKSPSARP